MPERDLAELEHGLTPNTFRVFAEWLRDNRQALERRLDSVHARLDGYDDRLEANQKALLAKLEAIHAETRRTNGRVTELERNADLAKAVADGHELWEHQRTEAEDRREDVRDRRVGLWIAAAGIALGLLLGDIGHVFGWW